MSAGSPPYDASTGWEINAGILNHNSEEWDVPDSSEKVVFLYLHRRQENAFKNHPYMQ